MIKNKRFVSFLILFAPLTYANYLPMQIINNAQIANDDTVYMVVKANNPLTGKQCLMRFDRQGKGLCEEVKSKTHFADYSYALSSLPLAGGQRVVYLPQVASGRVYFSIGNPMEMYIDASNPGNITVVDPDGFKPRDVNYYTLYDKIEFSFNNSGAWINPTAVDFFSLPISIQQSGSTSGVTQAGFTLSRAELLTQVETTFAKQDKTPSKIWSNLFLNYQDEDQGTTTFLRVMSTGKAMISNVRGARAFDKNYLANEQAYNFNYIDFLWDYYSRHTLTIDCSELQGNPNARPQLDDYMFTGKVVNKQFTFTNQTGSYSLSMNKPNSMSFFAGAGLLSSVLEANNTPGAIIVREMTSAFDVGLLPANDGAILNKDFFINNKEAYYQTNSLLPKSSGTGVWYDLYSKALHAFGSDQPIYTFAYDDALSQDGTLHDPNSSPSTVTVTLGDMTGTPIPSPWKDDATYTITTGIGANSVVKYIVNAKNRSQDIVLKNGQTLNNVSIPFKVELNGEVLDIYIKHPMVKPFTKASDGVVINQLKTGQVSIAFPGKPGK